MAAIEQREFKRQDGRDKVTGAGRYTGDLQLTGMAHGKLKHAGVAAAEIARIDTSKAEALPGVFAVVTWADVPDHGYGEYIHDQRLFVKDRVTFEGDIIAAVAAVSPEIAELACDLIEVELVPLPVVNDLEAALEPGSPLVHPDWEQLETTTEIVRSGNDACHSSVTHGDVEAGFAAADQIVKERYVADMSHAAPIEPRAIVAEWHGEQVTVYSSTQVPFTARAGVCETLGLQNNQVRVIVTHLGGGFGGKCGFHFEAHVAALAKKAQRPVKVVFSRKEEFLLPNHRREGMVIELETGVKSDGTITAKRGRLLIDNGAATADAGFFPELACMHAIGPYAIPAVDMHAHLVYTNHQPSGSVRAPTAPQATWASECHMDAVARAIGMDPVELRLKNVVRSGGKTATGQVLEPHGAPEAIAAAAEMIGWGRDLPEGEALGLAIGWWPSFGISSGAYIKLNGDGSGTIITGAQECGSGAVMALPRLAADQLGMRPDDFSIVYQDTEAAPYDSGASGSQTTFNNGRAVVAAAKEVREQLLDMASEKLEAAKGDLELIDGRVQVKGSPDKHVTIVDLAGEAAGGAQLLGSGSTPPPSAPELEGSACVGRMGMDSWVAPGFFCHAVHLKVDRETGVTRVLRVAAAHDSGTVINPIGAEGQVEGGVVMGIGQALLEGNRISEEGNMLGAGLLEYKLQTMSDVPPIEIRWVGPPADNAGPMGAKTVAEPPSVPTLGAIANAIRNATGVTVHELPMTPNRVWRAIASA